MFYIIIQNDVVFFICLNFISREDCTNSNITYIRDREALFNLKIPGIFSIDSEFFSTFVFATDTVTNVLTVLSYQKRIIVSKDLVSYLLIY